MKDKLEKKEPVKYYGWESVVAMIVLSKIEPKEMIDELISFIKEQKQKEYDKGREEALCEELDNLKYKIRGY